MSDASDASDSQNRPETPVADIPEAGTSPDPSSSSDDGERSTPSGMPPAATRARKKRNSDDEDSDFVVEEEVTSKPKRKVVAKEDQGQQSKKGTSKVKQSTVATKLNLEEPSKKVKQTTKRKRIVHVQGRKADMHIDPHADAAEEAEEVHEPAPQKQRLMGDAIRAGHSSMQKKPAVKKGDPKPAPSKPKPAPKPKRTIGNIPASEKNKDDVPPAESDDKGPVLLKLRPKLPFHNDAHPQAEDMKGRKDRGLRLWRRNDPYAVRRRTAVDPRFHTREQQDFYETVLMDKKPIVADTRYVDWKYIDSEEHRDFFPHVHESFIACGVADFVGQKLTSWNDEMIMQFYATAHFYPDGKIMWMTEGQRFSSTVEEWAEILNAPVQREDDVDVYGIPKKNHESMKNMYKEVPAADLEIWKLGSVYHLQAGLPTTNTILRHTLMPKSGDNRMIRGYSINMLHLFDERAPFKVMDLMVETIKRTAADQKRSCGFAPQIQMLINAKFGTGKFLLDREHLPLQPEHEDNVVVMDEEDPTSVKGQAKIEAAKKAKADKEAAAAAAKPKSFGEQILEATQRIEQRLASIVQSQESLERIVDEKIHALDVKLTEVQVTVNKLEADIEEAKQDKAELMRELQDDLVQDSHRQTAPVPRGSRSAAIPVTDTRTTASAPPTVPAVAPTPAPAPVSTPPAQTSAEVFADAVISTPTSTQTGAASKSPQ
jgi:hypothetical protein